MEDATKKLADSYTDVRAGFANEQAKKWVEERYVLLPTDKNGKPIKLGDFLRYSDEEPHEVMLMQLGYGGWTLYGERVFPRRSSSYEIVEPDSIEKLRGEMINLLYASAEEAGDLVDDWLKRAEKLFRVVE